ncbi:NADH-quinone oxidoreductase subunit C [Planctomicrobium sp. SH661]|uniref:NADH-quinone oxidoreductase subunit C n=1 Tax=Planctomicrobium sp. SH661 TaxID=3448124 RepID=UPI003F5C2E8C
MTFQEILQRLAAEFSPDIILDANAEARDPWVEVAPAAVATVGRFLKTDPSLQFNSLCDLSGVDYFEPDPKLAPKFPFEPHVEVVYHLLSLKFKHRLTMKVKLPRWKDDVPGQLPEVPTVSSVWAIADWHEREAYDLVGIHFVGHPNLVRILCVDDWVGHPLRKDYEFPLEYHGVRGR